MSSSLARSVWGKAGSSSSSWGGASPWLCSSGGLTGEFSLDEFGDDVWKEGKHTMLFNYVANSQLRVNPKSLRNKTVTIIWRFDSIYCSEFLWWHKDKAVFCSLPIHNDLLTRDPPLVLADWDKRKKIFRRHFKIRPDTWPYLVLVGLRHLFAQRLRLRGRATNTVHPVQGWNLSGYLQRRRISTKMLLGGTVGTK